MDAAFLNLEMPGMNGLALTRMIQKLQPRCNIIVVTEHPEYALEALQIFVSGFLLKPANEADVRNVLEHLRYPPENAPVGIKIQCFGNFEIFVGGRALAFKRSKSKELLAYLVDRNGATCTNGEMLAVLWEDKPDTASLHSHLRNLIFDLSHTAFAVSVTRQMTAMPISTGLPRQSLIFWRELLRVIILSEIFLLVDSAVWELLLPALSRAAMPVSPLFTSPLWLSLVPAAGFTAVQKGFTQ